MNLYVWAVLHCTDVCPYWANVSQFQRNPNRVITLGHIKNFSLTLRQELYERTLILDIPRKCPLWCCLCRGNIVQTCFCHNSTQRRVMVNHVMLYVKVIVGAVTYDLWKRPWWPKGTCIWTMYVCLFMCQWFIQCTLWEARQECGTGKNCENEW